jgi:hypothetical protein
MKPSFLPLKKALVACVKGEANNQQLAITFIVFAIPVFIAIVKFGHTYL